MLGLSAKSMREEPKTSANTAYARPLPTVTALQARNVPGLRLAGREAWRPAGMVTRTATEMANLLTVLAIHAARRASRSTGMTAPAARSVPLACLARCTAVRVAGVVRTARPPGCSMRACDLSVHSATTFNLCRLIFFLRFISNDKSCSCQQRGAKFGIGTSLTRLAHKVEAGPVPDCMY